MIARWLVPLAPFDAKRVKPDHLHGAVCGWLDDDHEKNVKSWSVGALELVDGVLALEIITLDDSAGRRILENAGPGVPVRLGRQFTEVLCGPQLVAQLASDAETRVPSAWSVSFLSPTAFGSGSRFSPWPDPRSVIRSTAVRYNAIGVGSQVLDPTSKLAASVWVSDVDGHNELVRIEKLTASGFVGRIRYVCDNEEYRPDFHALMQFAEFAGVGRYTTRGLGRIQLEPTWPA